MIKNRISAKFTLGRLERTLKASTVFITVLVVASVMIEVLSPNVAEAHKFIIELVDAAFIGVIAADLALRYVKVGDKNCS
jgi:hypothetical protein